MNGGGPSGFQNAPVTKGFIAATTIVSIVVGPRSRSLRLGLSYEDIFEKTHIWRLFTSIFVFSSTPELLFGAYLLYYFRVFERQIGSNKHSVFILFSIVISTLLEVLALMYVKDPILNALTSGPYGLIFASFLPFYFDIPVSSRFCIFSLQFTDKSFIYLTGLQLLFSSRKRSIIPGLCGLVAGSLYHLNAFGVRRAKFPNGLITLFSKLSFPSMHGSSLLQRGNRMGTGASSADHQVEENNFSTPFASCDEASESSLASLVSMGFDRNSARQALALCGNDVNAATNILLEVQPQ